jgi:hypothetical protein
LAPYEEVQRYVLAHGHHDIGLLMDLDGWEYPLWRVLQEAGVKPLRIEHVFEAPNMDNLKYPLGPFKPTLIIATVQERPPVLVLNGIQWRRRLATHALSVYTPDG